MSHDKNESVYLLPSEQDHQTNLPRTLDETNRNPVVQSPSIPCSIPAIHENGHEDEGVQSTSGETTGLELLFKEKAGLEEEFRLLDEAQERLNLRERILVEEMVQEMEKRNSEKRQEIIDLQAAIDNLETQLGALSVSDASEEEKAEKIDYSSYTLVSITPQEKLLDSEQNATVVEIIEEIR